MFLLEKLKKAFVPSVGGGRNYCLSLDVGTEFVKVLLFRYENGKAYIVGSGKFRQGLNDMQSGMVTDIAGVVANCSQAIGQAEEQADVSADQVIMGIAGELVKGAASIVKYDRANPRTKIDRKELEEIVEKVQWQAFDEARKLLATETGYQEIEVKLVNAAIVDVQIDGYRVNNPVGFQGKKVSVSVFNSFAPLVHLGALQSIAEDLELDLLSIATEPYAVALSVGSDEAGEFSAIFIDIGGGTTDIALVRNGGIAGTKMFNLGGRAFTKRLANHFNIPFEKAEQMKLDYAQDNIDLTTRKLVREVLEQDVGVWMSGVEMILDELSKSEHLPPRILLCGGGSCLPEIKEVLEKYDWQKNLPFARNPGVSFIKPEDVLNVIDETGQLNSPQDITPMAMANLALDLVGEEPVMDSVLRQVAKVLQN